MARPRSVASRRLGEVEHRAVQPLRTVLRVDFEAELAKLQSYMKLEDA